MECDHKHIDKLGYTMVFWVFLEGMVMFEESIADRVI